MRKYAMPKNRKQLEEMLMSAFDMGMTSAYAVEHTEMSDDEEILRDRYKAMIQGKCENMHTIIDGKMIYIERN